MDSVQGFTPYIKKKNVEGVEFDFYIGDVDGQSWYDIHCTDPDWPEMRFMRDSLVVPGDVIFECGGHHGCTALVLSRWTGPTGSVLSFEPHPRNADIFRRNMELNHIGNVSLRQCAVGASPGRVAISDASNATVVRDGAADSVNAELLRLDDLAHLRPTLLKIDVEGFEVEVLRGAIQILKQRPKLAIEIHTDLASRPSLVPDLFSCLGLSGYRQWIQWNDEADPVPYDGMTPITQRVHLFAAPEDSRG
jgi:FkbM family methyltransferase